LFARYGLILLILPLVELYLLIRLGQVIGALATVAIVVGTAIFGVWLLRFELRRVALQLQVAARQGEPPAGRVSDAAAIFMAAVLLMLPGLITDVLGLALLFPPTRRPLMKLLNFLLWPSAASMFSMRAGQMAGGRFYQGQEGTVWTGEWHSVGGNPVNGGHVGDGSFGPEAPEQPGSMEQNRPPHAPQILEVESIRKPVEGE
jgi:UPF0716 protein FxsA